MNKKAIFITLYLAIACFVGIGSYCIIDAEVTKRQTEIETTTTEVYVTESGDNVGLVDSIEGHVAGKKEDETTEYMADQLSPDFECYDSDNPDNPEAVAWYTPTTKATTEEPTTVVPSTTQTPSTTAAPGATEMPATTVAPATTEAPTTEAPSTEAPTTEAPETQAPTTEAPTTEAPATQAPSTDAIAE